MIDSKKTVNLVMNLPFAAAAGMMTVVIADKLGYYFEYGQVDIPASADYDSILQAILYGVFSFLGLLGIPRIILYLKGNTGKRWTFLMYWGLPFALAFFLPDKELYIAWTVIATLSWLEVLMALDPFGKIFLPPPTKR